MSEDATPEPVPPLLHSAFSEAPFRSCSVCGEDLLASSVPYQVQKVWRHGQVVFEMAVCARCGARLLREFSQESMARMQDFVTQRYRPNLPIAVCHFCGAIIPADGEYEIGAACSGSLLLKPVIVVCAACNSGLQEKLSRKTREAWGDFVERNFPGVPSEMEPQNTPLVL
jgi:hypothetical protein